jgi:fused signal recognition particle receptor
MNIFQKISQGLKKTRDNFTSKLNLLLTKIDGDFFDELEELLITCDIGVETSCEITERLKKIVKEKALKDPDAVVAELKLILCEMLGEKQTLNLSGKPAVILIIGVNGAGKTTTIGKLASQFINDGKKVIVAAADTFRAAAVEQLEIWCNRSGAEIVKRPEGSDPASVVFDALRKAKDNADVLIVDTAGRLHNKKGLMEELRKIARIIKSQSEGSTVETLLVLDATTGQNAVNQAEMFSGVADVTGIVLTKLDGTAKGGIVIPISSKLKIPVKFIGVGEKITDLSPFDPADFVEALFDTNTEFNENYERLTSEIEPEPATGSQIKENENIPVDLSISGESETGSQIKKDERLPINLHIDGDIFDDNDTLTEELLDDISEELTEEQNTENTENTENKPVKKKGKFSFLFEPINIGKKKNDSNSNE